MEEITNPLTKHISIGELVEIIASHKNNIDTTNAKEVQMMRLLETAMFHINELMITIDKTREDLNKSMNYSDNLRKELKNLVDVANSYLSESSKVVYEN
jgi:hypothetical protein